jgi:putative NADPH-quinone reductase
MRVLVLYAHPVEASFVAALRKRVVDTLRSRGHEVDDCDLNVAGFDPVLSRQDRIDYNNTVLNRMRVASYVDRLHAAESLVLVFPVWNEGFPAILKGLFDRVFLPEGEPGGEGRWLLQPEPQKCNNACRGLYYGLDRCTRCLRAIRLVALSNERFAP